MSYRLQLCRLTYKIINAVPLKNNLVFGYPFGENRRRKWANFAKQLHLSKWQREFCTASTFDGAPKPSAENNDGHRKSKVPQTFTMLKMKKERLGPLHMSDIKIAVASLQNQTVLINNEDFLELLQLTLNALRSEYRRCSNEVQEVWNLYASRKEAKLTLQHLHVYFQMCHLAEVSISYEDMLKLLENHNIQISRELLEIATLILGRKGNLESMQKVLAFMKENNIALTEAIFSAFILAHGFSRDLNGITSILDTMHSVQMTFTPTAFHALLTAYAVCGDFPRVRYIVQQMNRAKVECTPEQLQSVIIDFVKNNTAGENFENMDYIVGLLDNQMELDLSTTVLHLMHRGHVKEAIRLLSSHTAIWKNPELYSNARVYIQEMIHADTEPNLTVEMCNLLEDNGISEYALLVALEIALTEKREELAWVLLKALKDKEKPIRLHYFWPLFCNRAISSTRSSKVIEHVKMMVQLGTTPDLETLRDFIIPSFSLKLPSSTELMLKDAGLTVTQIATPLLIVLLRHNMVNKALNYANSLSVEISMSDVIAPLAGAWAKTPQATITLLAQLIEKSKMCKTTEDAGEDWGGQFLLDIMASRGGLNSHQIIPLFKELGNKNIMISENSVDLLVDRANEGIQEILKDNANLIIGLKYGWPPKEPNYAYMPHPNDMNTEDLEGHLVELKSKHFKMRGTIRKLILLHAAQNDTKKVLSLFKEMEDSGEKISPGMLASVLNTYMSLKNVDAALNTYKIIKEKFPSFNLDNYKIIDLSTLLVENGDWEVAVETLKNGLPLLGNKSSNQKQVRRNCQKLLSAAAETCDYEITKQIFTILRSRNIILADNLMLGTLVKCRLNSGDLSATVQEVKDLYKSFCQIPMRIEVLIHLLNNSKDSITSKESGMKSHRQQSTSPDSLVEEMLNIIAECNGAKMAQHDLLFACLEGGYPMKAKQVLKALGKTLDMSLLQHQYNRYAKISREEPLLHLLTATKIIPNIRREEIFKALLEIYYVQNDGIKGLSLWIRMQEEDVSPSPSFLNTLASLLAANDIDIPFEVLQSI